MRKYVGLSLVILFTFATTGVVAQDTGFFSGNGLKNGWGSTSSKGSSTKPDSLFGNQQGANFDPAPKSAWELPKFEMPKFKKPKFEMPKLFQGNKFPKPIQLSDSPNQGLLSGFPKFDSLSGNKPTQPNFFQRMNDRTREVFGQTRDSFSNLSERSRGTWDSITRGINGDIGGSGNRNAPPVQPNLRSARQADGSTSKF